jgi:hypothetical protein
MKSQMVTTNPLPPDGCFALIYVTPGQQPMNCVMPNPPDEFVDAQTQQQAKIAGPGGAPILKDAVSQRFIQFVYFPAMRLAVYVSIACAEEFRVTAERLEQAKDAAAANAAEQLAPTLAAIKRLPTSPVVRPPDQE